jgi:uncharacterized protein (TIGR02145 family)
MKKILSLSVLLFTATFFYGCKKDTQAKVPVLTTTPVTNITASTATSGGLISSDGGVAITVRGVCWSITADPTTADSKTTDGEGTGQFVSSIGNLSGGATYHVRAYATNSAGTAYGEDLTFTTTGQTPSATSQAATNITATGATLNGTVNANDLAATVTFEYGPTTSYGQTVAAAPGQVTGNTDKNVNAIISGLSSGVTYHFRIKAVNSDGTAYGTDLTFTTTDVPAQVTDIDGNIYNTVTIGTQVWLTEGLKTTKYNDGSAITNITDNTAWSTNATGAYCDYANTPANSSTYGRLYNWYVIGSTNPKNVCPTGWHVATDADWTALATYLGGESVAGGKLKETGTTHWATPNTGATNETGFTALPGGYRSQSGSFGLSGTYGFWWTATEGGDTFAFYRYMFNTSASLGIGDNEKHGGFYVRCMMN